MKDYNESLQETLNFENIGSINEAKEQIILDALVPKMFESINEEDEKMLSKYVNETVALLIENGMPEDKINEGFLGNLIGGAAGFFIGPKIGKVIARALGVQKGVLYDMFTSKLVGIALGTAISKSMGKK